MLHKKKIFASINLLLFITSLSFVIVIGLKDFSFSYFLNHGKHIVAKPNLGIDNTGKQLTENNETEVENDTDFELDSVLLPFHVSFKGFEILSPFLKTFQITVVTVSQPIYLAVRKFQI